VAIQVLLTRTWGITWGKWSASHPNLFFYFYFFVGELGWQQVACETTGGTPLTYVR